MFQTIRLKAEASLNGPNLIFHMNNKEIMARSKYEIWLKVYFHLYATNPQLAEQIFKIDCNSVEEYVDQTLTKALSKGNQGFHSSPCGPYFRYA
jgi:hypothetical protein